MAIAIKKFSVAFTGASKASVIETNVIDTPVPQGVALYMNSVDNQRQTEIDSGWMQLVNHAIEEEAYEGVAGTGYFAMPIGAGSGTITLEPILGNIPPGHLILGIAGNFRDLDRGSEIFKSMTEYCRMAAHDNFLKLV